MQFIMGDEMIKGIQADFGEHEITISKRGEKLYNLYIQVLVNPELVTIVELTKDELAKLRSMLYTID